MSVEKSPEITGQIELTELMTEVEQRIKDLRTEQRQQVKKVLQEVPPLGSNYTGDVFVESLGTILKVRDGDYQHVYDAQAINARDVRLKALEPERSAFFDKIGAQFDNGSRVLNIGAGGDITSIQSYERAGHEVLSTDMAQDAVNILKDRTATPAFAVDLENLTKVLPANSMDIVVGNSTLAYVDPNKMRAIVENLVNVMKKGAVFSFDLYPHASYFHIENYNEKQTVINESDVDPVKLLEFIKKFGVDDGINAMAYYQAYRELAVQLAVMSILKDLFEEQGMKCSLGVYESENDKELFKTLRVSADGTELLRPVNNESIYGSVSDIWDELASKGVQPYLFTCIDRVNAKLLADQLGLQGGKRELPWIVAEFVNSNQHPSDLPEAICQKVITGLNPKMVKQKIADYIDGKEFKTPASLPFSTQIDQVLHKFLLTGESTLSLEMAEMKIDEAYEKDRQKQIQKSKRKVAKAMGKSKKSKKKKR